MKRKRASGVPGGNTPIQEAILQALQRDGQLCADAQFLNGLLPSLKRLPLKKLSAEDGVWLFAGPPYRLGVSLHVEDLLAADQEMWYG
ncbi:unnamed protein product [Arctogadus glacialis]